ncbi:MAG: HAD family hydrolase [Clostridia bacterium]|nr:HAD family hydrolase [Clostridia bacterium]
MVNAVIFDLDGTLADTMDDLKTAMNNMLKSLGYKTRTKPELLSFINRGARNFVKSSLPKIVQDSELIVDSALDVYEQEYAKCYCESTYAFDGVKEALEGLKEKGIRIGVLSNKQDAFVKHICEKLFGKGFFKATMGQTSLPTKPDPQGALLMARLLGAKPQNCIIVGDSDVDMMTAQNAGMTSIGVSWGYRSEDVLSRAGADYIVGSTEELLEAIYETVKKNQQKRLKGTKTEN